MNEERAQAYSTLKASLVNQRGRRSDGRPVQTEIKVSALPGLFNDQQ